ncbi:hypothetical protein [Aliivibrio sifiae]|uniref:Uncharacterized protein n=1 Tax=Aliivibrio sifiae TaxID=566293 RepID=A0A2S7X4U1_9GAMM|nr:hypothetical protein [Aliivibrio sifiae]PQJ85182.1 hypothetical protein BTO22_17130 [Aliivibrio sifiae]
MDYEALADNFQDGDVIYGLDSPRAVALATLKNRGINRTQPITTAYCCGLFGSTAIKRHIIIQNDITNAVWDPSSPKSYFSNKSINRGLIDGPRGVAFKKFIENDPYYNVASRHDPELDPQKRAKNAWQRTSKCGLKFHIESRGTIHFIITNLQIDAVVSKVGYGESITSAELRWLYRHKNVQAVIDHVKFYVADKEVLYQDVFNDRAWDTYIPSNTYGSDGEVLRISKMIDQVRSARI